MSRILTVFLLGAVALGTGCAENIEGEASEGQSPALAAQLANRKLSAEIFGCEGTQVALETRNGKNYLTAVVGGGFATLANASKVGKAETFKVYDLGDDRVALQVSNGNYLVADGIFLNANASSISASSTFKVTWSKDGEWLYLRSNSNGYVTAEGGGGGVANAGWPIIGDNQSWKAVCVEGDSSSSTGSTGSSTDPWGNPANPPTRGGSSSTGSGSTRGNDDVSSATGGN